MGTFWPREDRTPGWGDGTLTLPMLSGPVNGVSVSLPTTITTPRSPAIRLFLTSDDAAVRRAAADPLDPGQRHLRRLLPQLPADGELPRHRPRDPAGVATRGGIRLSPFAAPACVVVLARHAVQRQRSRSDSPDEIFFGLASSRRRRRRTSSSCRARRARTRCSWRPGACRSAPLLKSMPPLRAYAIDIARLDGRHRRLHRAVGRRDAADRLVHRPRACSRPARRLGDRAARGSSAITAASLVGDHRSSSCLVGGAGPDLVALLPDRHVHGPAGVRRDQRQRHPAPGALAGRSGRSEPFYEQIYHWFPDRTYDNVLIVGAGSAARTSRSRSRTGAGHIDAVEIDPAIQRDRRPRRTPTDPYHDPRVTRIDERRPRLPAPHRQAIRPRHLRPARLADPGQHVGEPPARVVPVHGRGVRERARPPARRTASSSSTTTTARHWLPQKLGGMLQDAFGLPPIVRTRTARRAATLAVGPTIAALDGRAPPGDADRPDRPDGCAHSRRPTTGRSSTCANAVHRRRTTSPPSRSIVALRRARRLACRLAAAGRRSAASARTSSCSGVAFLLLETRSLVSFSLLFGTTWLVNALVVLRDPRERPAGDPRSTQRFRFRQPAAVVRGAASGRSR